MKMICHFNDRDICVGYKLLDDGPNKGLSAWIPGGKSKTVESKPNKYNLPSNNCFSPLGKTVGELLKYIAS